MSSAWQDDLARALKRRNTQEHAYADLIVSYAKLARTARGLQERNRALLGASRQVRAEPSTAASSTAGPAGSGDTHRASGTSSAGDGNPVLKAYADSLESQVASLRTELSDAYKAQGQATLKLLSLTEAIQEKETEQRTERDELRRLTEAEARWRRNGEEWTERLRIKDHDILNLQDEVAALNLELNQGALRFDALRRDNGQLLQRWLDKMGQEADEMNDRSGFVEAEASQAAPPRTRTTSATTPPSRARTTSATNASSSSSRLRPSS